MHHRAKEVFHVVLGGTNPNVGIRDVTHRLPGRSATYQDDAGIAAIWGEVYHRVRETLNAVVATDPDLLRRLPSNRTSDSPPLDQFRASSAENSRSSTA